MDKKHMHSNAHILIVYVVLSNKVNVKYKFVDVKDMMQSCDLRVAGSIPETAGWLWRGKMKEE